MSDFRMLRAVLPLEDARIAAMSMSGCDYAVNWRHDFIVAITALRAVGHVLKKVDTVTFPEIADEVAIRFQRWRLGSGDDAIFPHFIEDARNQVLKAYQFPASDGRVFEDEELGLAEGGFEIDQISDGQLKGESVTSLVHFSCEWWSRELTEISKGLSPKRTAYDLAGGAK